MDIAQIATFSAAFVTVATAAVNAYAQRSTKKIEITSDDNSKFRTDLLAQVNSLSDDLDALRKENNELIRANGKLEGQVFQTQRELELTAAKINEQTSELARIRTDLLASQKIIEDSKKELQELRKRNSVYESIDGI